MSDATFRRADRKPPWIASPRSGADKGVRLICLPHAGANASVYRLWSQGLHTPVEVCSVEYPGHGSRIGESPCSNLVALAHAFADAIVPWLDRPFAFFGHSMGALVAFEASRRLRSEHGFLPFALFTSACRAPHVPDPDPPTFALEEAEFLQELLRLGGTQREVLETPELLELLLPVLRADFEAVQAYEYHAAAPLACPITTWGGLDDEEVTAEALADWGEHTTRAFELRWLPGGHFFPHTDESRLLSELAELIDKRDEAPQVRGPGSAAAREGNST